MAYMTETKQFSASQQVYEDSGMTGGDPSMLSYTLRRVGARPLQFRGAELGMAMSFTPGLPYWFEINLFRTADGGFVTAIKTFYTSEDERDICRAMRSSSLDEALSQLEAYDPAHDVRVGAELGRSGLSSAELYGQALELQARIAGARQHYSALLGEFLYELDEA